MKINKILIILAGLIVAGSLQAAPPGAEMVLARLDRIMPGVKPDSVAKAPVDGFFEVVFGPKVVYMSDDGRYLLQASIIDLDSDENLTETRRSAAVKSSLEKVGEAKMVSFGDKDKAKHTISVFTDIDCGYCRKLHSEMAAYNKAGIRVRYLFYPRAGLNTPSYDKAVSVWCADDRNAAMTKSKAGEKVPDKTCDNPVREHMQLGELMGVSGTPALVLPDGSLLPGYVPADRLSQYLDAQEKRASN
jgi:thiol:disulfide interchange protein DsbC